MKTLILSAILGTALGLAPIGIVYALTGPTDDQFSPEEAKSSTDVRLTPEYRKAYLDLQVCQVELEVNQNALQRSAEASSSRPARRCPSWAAGLRSTIAKATECVDIAYEMMWMLPENERPWPQIQDMERQLTDLELKALPTSPEMQLCEGHLVPKHQKKGTELIDPFSKPTKKKTSAQ